MYFTTDDKNSLSLFEILFYRSKHVYLSTFIAPRGFRDRILAHGNSPVRRGDKKATECNKKRLTGTNDHNLPGYLSLLTPISLCYTSSVSTLSFLRLSDQHVLNCPRVHTTIGSRACCSAPHPTRLEFHPPPSISGLFLPYPLLNVISKLFAFQTQLHNFRLSVFQTPFAMSGTLHFCSVNGP